jgi:hypothetical protein
VYVASTSALLQHAEEVKKREQQADSAAEGTR